MSARLHCSIDLVRPCRRLFRCIRSWYVLLLRYLAALFVTVAASAHSATLVWDPNPEKDLAGYFVYVTSEAQAEHFRVDVGLLNTFSLAFAKPGHRYDFFVTAYNRAGIESDPSEILQYDVPIPFGWPAFLSQPADVSVRVGQSAFFSIQTSGTTLLNQWFKDGVELPGQTNIFLQIPAVTEAHAGRYSVQIRNPLGALESRKALLQILTPPKIIFQDRQVVATEGNPIELSVEASGTFPLSFKWLKADIEFEDSDMPWFFLPSVTLEDSGTYFVVVENDYGSVKSDPIQLTVDPLPKVFLSVHRKNEIVTIQIEGVPLAAYDVQVSNDVLSNTWETLRNVMLDESGTFSFDVVADSEMQFLRIQANVPE